MSKDTLEDIKSHHENSPHLPMSGQSVGFLLSEIERLQKQLDTERIQHEKECGELVKDVEKALNQVSSERARAERYREVLEKIAKPRLGGKEQQYWAQEALAEVEAKP